MTSQTLTLLGLGQLGLPVAVALLAAGHRVQGVDTLETRRALAAHHGLVALAAAAHTLPRTRWLVTVLPDDNTLAAALADQAGTPGAMAHLMPGGVHLCIGTLGVAQAEGMAAAHSALGQHFIAAPVFGRPDEAWARDMTALLGASAGLPDADRTTARELLGCVAPRIFDVESPAGACAVKLAGNLMIASAIATMTEAFSLAQRHGAPAALVHEVVTRKLFKGPVYEGVGRRLVQACSGQQPAAAPPGFTLRLGLKDLALCRAAAHAVNLDLPVGNAVQQRLQCAADRGHAERDWAELPACLP